MKKTLAILLLLCLAAAPLSSFVSAEEVDPEAELLMTTTQAPKLKSIVSELSSDRGEKELAKYRTASGEEKLAHLKEYALKAIDRRITVLTNLKSKLQASQVLSANDLNTLLTSIDNAIKTLQTTQTQISAITSVEQLDELKTLTKSIFESNKVFGVLVPKVNGLRGVAAIQNVLNEHLNAELVNKLETAANNLADSDTDKTRALQIVASLETLIAKVQSELTLAKAQYDAVDITATFATSRAKLAEARTHLSNARTSLNEIRTQLEELKTILGMVREENATSERANETESTPSRIRGN
ncbi:MAG: hypothetical protein Fur003_0290 [Candidatus Dojkabacteria bacterium]